MFMAWNRLMEMNIGMEFLQIKKVRPDAVLPRRATAQSAGYDLCACIGRPFTLAAGKRAVIPTGIAIATGRPDVAAFVFGRSGLGINHGIAPSNAVGVIDADYRGEILVGLTNHSDEDYTIEPGERVAQLVLMPVLTPGLREVAALPGTERGSGGFGSTGRD